MRVPLVQHTLAAAIKALPWSLRLLARVISEQPEAVEIVRRDGTLLFANPALVSQLGYTLPELLGQVPSALTQDDLHPPAFFAALDDCLSRGEIVRTTLISRRRDGARVEQAAMITPLKAADGREQWMLVHRRVPTPHTEDLEGDRAAPTVDGADEIRNPLVWMLEHAHGLPSAPADAQMKELAEGREVLRGALDALMTLSQHDDGRREPVSMSALLDRALTRELEVLKHVQIDREPSSEALQVLASPRLVEALAYILRDAGQVSSAGTVITIRVRAARELTQLWIMDEGGSIAEADLPRVLEPLFRARPLSDGLGLGLGLGLPAAERIVRGLGGTLTIANRHRTSGTVTTIMLQSVRPQHATTDTAAMRVLVVDDEPRVSRSLVRLLRKHDVTTVSSGVEALQCLSARSFDLVICDLKMPGMTGMALFEQLESERPEQAARFLFTTGGAWAAESQRFIAKHAERIVPKPFNRQQLEQAITRIQD